MSEAAEKAFGLFQADVGNDEGTGEWFEVTQDQIDKFADEIPCAFEDGNLVGPCPSHQT